MYPNKYLLLLLLIAIIHAPALLSAQSPFVSDIFYPHRNEKKCYSFGGFQTRAEKRADRDSTRLHRRKERREAWLAKPYHVYIGLDLLWAYRLNSMRLINSPVGIASYHDWRRDGILSGRAYIGINFKQYHFLDLSYDDLPIHLEYAYQNHWITLTSSTIALISLNYRYDVLRKSKVVKIYPGMFFGLGYFHSRVEYGQIESLSITGQDSVHEISSLYYKTYVVPAFGASTDLDFCIKRFAIGGRFRLYYSPMYIWGKNVQFQHNSEAVQNFKVESSILNFHVGIGVRYTF